MKFRGFRGGCALGPVFALVIVLSGCGSSGETAAEEVPRLTKAQLAKRLGEICSEHTYEQVDAVEKFDKEHGWPHDPGRENLSEAQLEAELTMVIVPIVRDTIHDFRAKLRPPLSEEAKLEALYKALEHGIEVSEEDPSWVTETTAKEPFRHARLMSAKLGTPLCGQA
jgi:hypothetical protein